MPKRFEPCFILISCSFFQLHHSERVFQKSSKLGKLEDLQDALEQQLRNRLAIHNGCQINGFKMPPTREMTEKKLQDVRRRIDEQSRKIQDAPDWVEDIERLYGFFDFP